MSKTLTCREMGGPCDEPLSGNDLKEISDKGSAHVQNAADDEHKKTLETMQTWTPEEISAWAKKTQELLDSKQEDA